jgi:hypothetical protein
LARPEQFYRPTYTLRHSTNWREKKNAHQILVGISDGKGPLERLRRRSEGNIKIDFKGVCGLNSSRSGYGQMAGSCGYDKKSLGFIKGREFLD